MVLINSGSRGSRSIFCRRRLDQHIDAALEGAGDPPLREVEKLVAREHPAWTLAKGVQEVEFGSRHGDFGARGTDQLAQRQMNLPARECDRLSRGCGEETGSVVRRRSTARIRASSSRGLNGFGK